VPINNQSTLQGSANGSSEDAVPIDNQSTPQGPADEDALLQYEIVSIPPGDDGRVSNKLGYKKRYTSHVLHIEIFYQSSYVLKAGNSLRSIYL
jgi:hypothetical protein